MLYNEPTEVYIFFMFPLVTSDFFSLLFFLTLLAMSAGSAEVFLEMQVIQ